MKTIILDGRKMNNQEMVHEYLRLKLRSTEYLGNNLDALWDILSSYDQDVEIKLVHGDYLIQNLNEYGEKILKLFLEAANQNDKITVEVESDSKDIE